MSDVRSAVRQIVLFLEDGQRERLNVALVLLGYADNMPALQQIPAPDDDYPIGQVRI